MNRPIILWGGTGQARVLAEFLPALGFAVTAIFDNDPACSSPLPGVPIHLGEAGFNAWLATARRPLPACLAAIGGERGADRLQRQRLMVQAGCEAITAIHPAAWVAASARLGSGSQILARAAVGAEARLGEAVIVNTAASVDHECVLGDGVHIAPGATLCGLVHVGDCSLIGAGAVVLPGVKIGRNTVIGAGSVVSRDVPDNVVAFGNPARIIRARAPQAAEA